MRPRKKRELYDITLHFRRRHWQVPNGYVGGSTRTNRLSGSGFAVDKHSRHVHHTPLRAMALASAERLRLCVRVPKSYLQWFTPSEGYVINVPLPEKCPRGIISCLES